MDEANAAVSSTACPKCGMALDEKAIACPGCGEQVVKAKSKTVTLTTGQKIAAAVFIINGLALLAEMFIFKDSGSTRSARGAIISIVLGAYLFTGRSEALLWGKIGTIIGLVFYTAIYVIQKDYFTAVIQVLFSLSLIGLIFGKAGKIRIILCSLVILGYLGLEGLGLYMEAKGQPVADEAVETEPVK